MKAIRVIIVDDHAIVRAGVRLLLEAEPDIEVVAEAAGGEEGLILASRHRPDVVIMDVAMPGMDGITATRLICERCPGVSVVGLTMYDNEHYFLQLVQAGANGYVLKGAAPGHLLEAVRSAARGETYLHPTLARLLVDDYRRRDRSGDVGLTEREMEVLQLIAQGHTRREVARRLCISPHTVERHRANLMAKLNMGTKADLVQYALRQGLVPPSEAGENVM